MIIIRGGNVHDGLGQVLESTDIIIEDGKIKQVGKNLSSDGCTIVEAAGKLVMPGFIDTLNTHGGKGPGWREQDLGENSDPITPEMNVIYSFDHDGMNFQHLYKYGTTTSGIVPLPSNIIGGQLCVVKTYGATPYKMLVKECAAMSASVSSVVKDTFGEKKIAPMTKMGIFAMLKAALLKAKAYQPDKGYDAKCEALLPILNGEKQLIFNCETVSEINAVVMLMSEFEGIKYMLSGALSVNADCKDILEKKIPVILGDAIYQSAKLTNQIDYDFVAQMIENGNDVAFANCGSSFSTGKESLIWNSTLWHKNGISAGDILRGLTSVPAKLLGVSDRVGSIEVGKDADICIWSANPITTFTAKLEAVYLEGRDMLNMKEERVSCW